ncbi:MAG: response regulator [Nitrospinae bacterium]|nr:response regulator [Nitrospinota bacterium]
MEHPRKTPILVVEDEKDIRTILEFVLSREGYEVVIAENGKMAKSFVDDNEPVDLVLLDIMLPYFDGFEIVTQIRSKEAWKSVPIIMLTSRSNEKDIVKALELGANDYVTKPFNVKELMARVKRNLK